MIKGIQGWFTGYSHRLGVAGIDLWTCVYSTVAVALLIGLVFKSPQSPEIINNFQSYVNSVTPHGANWGTYVMTVASVVYCTAAIFYASVAAIGRTRHQTSPVAYCLATLTAFSSLGMLIGNSLAWVLILISIAVLLIVPAFATNSANPVHIFLDKYAVEFSAACIVVGFVFGLVVFFDPVGFPRIVSTWPIIYVAVGFWTLAWTLAFVALPRSKGWPAAVSLVPIVLIVLFSRFNDDHQLRTIDPKGLVQKPPVQLDHGVVEDWLAKHCPATRASCHVTFIAAQGGGQRALYWTQAVLAALTEQNPNFDQSVFAFSGVSGGSMGGVSYFLARSEAKKYGVSWDNAKQGLADAASDDNLAPIIGALLFRAPLQAAWPLPIDGLDRARVFEQGVEDTWKSKFKLPAGHVSTAMSDPFPDALSTDSPAMFLNSTMVENGERVVNSSLLVTPEDPANAIYLGDRKLNVANWPMATSTAIHLSARFSYVNPHATVKSASGGIWGRLVDGGYNDGTGLVTILEVIDAFNAALGPCHKTKTCPQISLIYITNDPSIDDQLDGTPIAPSPVPSPASSATPAAAPTPTAIPSSTPSPAPGEKRGWLWEVSTPIDAAIAQDGNAKVSALRVRVNAEARAHVTFRVISLKRLVALYNAGAMPEEIRIKTKDWPQSDMQKPSLGWWLSDHSLILMNDVLQTMSAPGPPLHKCVPLLDDASDTPVGCTPLTVLRSSPTQAQ